MALVQNCVGWSCQLSKMAIVTILNRSYRTNKPTFSHQMSLNLNINHILSNYLFQNSWIRTGNYPGRFLNLLFRWGELPSIHNTFLEPEVQNLWHVMIGFENKISFDFVKHPGRLWPIFCWKSTLPPILLKPKEQCTNWHGTIGSQNNRIPTYSRFPEDSTYLSYGTMLGDLRTIDQFQGPDEREADVLVSNRSCQWNAASVWITDLVWYKRKLQSVVSWPWLFLRIYSWSVFSITCSSRHHHQVSDIDSCESLITVYNLPKLYLSILLKNKEMHNV